MFKKILGTIVIFMLCGSILVVVGLAEQWGLGHYAISLSVVIFGGLIYRITRWMRGPGSELGTPVPSLNLTERQREENRADG